jgi:alpha-D-ribose 1-methylphosphonate 5-triphosphate synthase subunit PhnH
MADINDAVSILAKTAGWSMPAPINGTYCFRLDDNLDMSLSAPDGKTLFFRARLAPLPASPADASAMLALCAHDAVGAVRHRSSICSLEDHNLMLHTSLPLRDALSDAQSLTTTAKNFLNDLAWWQTRLNPAAQTAQTASSFFSGGFSL